MARTSVPLVKAIMRDGQEASDYDGVTDLAPHIAVANSIVNRVVLCVTRKGLTVSDEDLELLERWLAAWSYGNSDRLYMSRSTGGASGSFGWKVGDGFASNPYGQNALMLDGTGCLTEIGNQQRASITWVGKTPSERIPIDQRD